MFAAQGRDHECTSATSCFALELVVGKGGYPWTLTRKRTQTQAILKYTFAYRDKRL